MAARWYQSMSHLRSLSPQRLPERAWQEIAVDLLGPLPTGEHLLVVVDYFSRWMEVDVLRSTTSAAVIKCLDSHFARYGVPAGLRTGNGSNLVSEEMEKYLEDMKWPPVVGTRSSWSHPKEPSTRGICSMSNVSWRNLRRMQNAVQSQEVILRNQLPVLIWLTCPLKRLHLQEW